LSDTTISTSPARGSAAAEITDESARRRCWGRSYVGMVMLRSAMAASPHYER
jgi:hypothetical protein